MCVYLLPYVLVPSRHGDNEKYPEDVNPYCYLTQICTKDIHILLHYHIAKDRVLHVWVMH